jgi:hypothetical protein
MYLTQGSFFGKTGPIDPARRIPENPKFEEKYYPNRWTEDRNLRTMHSRVNSVGGNQKNFRGSLLGNKTAENSQLNVKNQKYLAVS